MVPATPYHVHVILEQGLRAQDVDEVAALGHTPEQALLHAYGASGPLVFTILADGKPAGMFGVVGGPKEGTGVPWMLGTDRLLAVARDLMSQSPLWINFMLRLYPRLENYVDARNTVSLRWLDRMGFTFPGDELAVGGNTFKRFVRHV